MKGIRSAGLVLLLCASGSEAQQARQTGSAPGAVGIEQRLGEQVRLDRSFRDERGGTITLGEAADGKPVLLALVYYRCPMLCNQILGGLQEALVQLGFPSRQEVSVLTVSFDPREGPELAASRRTQYLRALGTADTPVPWRFLTGSAEAVDALCRESGFRVLYDAASGLYSHASALLVLTPEGRISRYFMGVSYPARDLRLALQEASGGRIGGVADRLLLLCFRYDPASGTYTLAVWRLLRAASVVTLLALAALLIRLSRIRRASVPAAGGRPEHG